MGLIFQSDSFTLKLSFLIILVIEKLQQSIYPLGEAQVFRVKRFYVTIIAVLLFHGALFLIFEKALKNPAIFNSNKAEEVPFIVELESLYYVEVNPEVEENSPDSNKNYSFKNQQAADLLEGAQISAIPNSEGTQTDTLKIVQGDLMLEEMQVAAGDYSYSKNDSTNTLENALAESGSKVVVSENKDSAPNKMLQAEIKADPINKPILDDGEGSAPAKTTNLKSFSEINSITESDKVVPLSADFSKSNDQIKTSNLGQSTASKRPVPMARPKLPTNITEAPLMANYLSVHKIGTIALDATFSEFGEYNKQFYAALQLGWFNEVEFFKPLDSGTIVQVSFILKSSGAIDLIEVIGTNASFLATTICENAIRKRSPFRPWTAEMVQVFGDQKEIKVKFLYH